MAAPTLATEALLYGSGVAPADAEPDQVVKARFDFGALDMRKGFHVGHGVDDHQVGEADRDGEFHGMGQSRHALAVRIGPRSLVTQGGDRHGVVSAGEDVHHDGASMDRVFRRPRVRAERGDGVGLRHSVIVPSGRDRAPTPPRCTRAGWAHRGSTRSW